MEREENIRFDAIVVGAGLAGLSAAYTLAAEGLDVLVLERGDYPGAKNVTGGRIYVSPIRDLFPDLWKQAPLERFIAHEEICLMGRDSSLTMRYDGRELSQESRRSYSVLRSRFDKWFARQAERKGATIVCKTRVDDVIRENGRVVGVVAAGDRLTADVVIACDGVLSFTAEKAGLNKTPEAGHFGVGVKEVIEMDPAVIEERFNLTGDEGAARLFLGDVTAGKFGGGFLYTNRSSVSLGVVLGIGALTRDGAAVSVPGLLEGFRQRPEISRLISGGEAVEYSAHMIPEGGLKAMGRLYGDGILVAGDAAGFAVNIGITVRGMEYAMASGYYAARAVIEARKKNDFGASTLSVYEKLLNECFVLTDFKSFRDSLNVLEYPPLYGRYPQWILGLMKDLYEIPAGPKARIFPTVRKHLGVRELWAMASLCRRMMKL
ncbi:MAG: FAD-dependent oxidoreductase [Syntrophaceae bacterium]|nr:FAD-dependent oxidoreductase [Syntrophaceae bacterium]